MARGAVHRERSCGDFKRLPPTWNALRLIRLGTVIVYCEALLLSLGNRPYGGRLRKDFSEVMWRRMNPIRGDVTSGSQQSQLQEKIRQWSKRLDRGVFDVEREGRWDWRFDTEPPELSIALGVDAATLTLHLGLWGRRWKRDEDHEFEVLDLVAASLFGRIRVVSELRGDTVVSVRLEVQLNDERWVTGDTRRERRAWMNWSRRRTRIEVNRGFTPPPELRWGTPGLLPHARWVGMLATDESVTPVELIYDGELDLHPIPPQEVGALVREYIDQCRVRGVLALRLVHGKGKGHLRRTVHAELERHPAVAAFRLGGMGGGSWGATLVDLHPPQQSE